MEKYTGCQSMKQGTNRHCVGLPVNLEYFFKKHSLLKEIAVPSSNTMPQLEKIRKLRSPSPMPFCITGQKSLCFPVWRS